MTRPDTPPDRRTPTRSSRSAATPTSSRTPTRCWPRPSAVADEDALVDAGLPRDGSGQTRRPRLGAPGLAGAPPVQRRGGLDVVGHSKLIYKITAVVVLLCLAVDDLPRLQLRHRLRGRQQLPGARHAASSSAEVRTAAEDAGAEVATAQVGRRQHRPARAPASSTTTGGAHGPATRSPQAAGVAPEEVSPESVSADWGNDITDQALIAPGGLPGRRRRSSSRCGSSRRWPSARSSSLLHDIIAHRRHLLAGRLRGHAVDGRSAS